MIQIDRVATITPPDGEPPYSMYGYLVTPDGTSYALGYQWWHGAMLALLYPEQAKAAGYEMPDDPHEVDVYEFQRFELDNHDLFPVIRICASRMIGTPISLDRGGEPSTPDQIATLRKIFKVLGLRANDKVATDRRDIAVRNIWPLLEADRDVYGDEPREIEKHPLIKKGEEKWDVIDAWREGKEAPKVAKLKTPRKRK